MLEDDISSQDDFELIGSQFGQFQTILNKIEQFPTSLHKFEQIIYLFILTHRVTKRNKAWLELIGSQATRSGLVKVIEGGAELIELLLSDTLGITG